MNGSIKCWRCNGMVVNPMNHDGAAWQLHFFTELLSNQPLVVGGDSRQVLPAIHMPGLTGDMGRAL